MKQKLEDHSYITALVLIAIAALLQTAVFRRYESFPPYAFSLAAVALASWIGGYIPGLIALIGLTSVANIWWVQPHTPFEQKSIDNIFSLVSFIGVGIVIIAAFEASRRAMQKLEGQLEDAEAARDRAEEANRLKRNFIANMSHEIRAPLSAVLGFSEVLAKEGISASDRQTDFERLKVNAAALTHLVTDLLDVTELDSEFFVANRKRMELPDFVQKIYETFSPLAQEKGLKFKIQLRGSAPKFVESDSEQLMQVLRQVVGNAIRYTDDGTILVTVSASKADTERRQVAFIVSDQGGGISTEVKKKLFRPFPSDEVNSSRTHGGTGMGLAIARRLARGLGGDVKLTKSDRRGSTFLITFDAGPVNESGEIFDVLADASRAPYVSPDDPHALDGIRILVVDDSPDSAMLVSRMLRLVGAEVDTAYRGQEGIDKATTSLYDIVLMDIQMPEMDGNEATRELRARGFHQPIIALSAHVTKEDQELAERSGVNEYLMKPVSRRALLQRVGHYARCRDIKSGAHKRPQEEFDGFGGMSPATI